MTQKIKGEEILAPVTARFSQPAHQALADAAYARRTTKTQIIVDAVAAWLAKPHDPAGEGIDLSSLGAARAELARELLALDLRDMELALRMIKWWKEPQVEFAQLVLKPGVALALGDEGLRREVMLQAPLPEEKP